MTTLLQLGCAPVLLYIGLKKGAWYIRWPALICAMLLALRPLDALIHWTLQAVPAFLGA